MGTLKAIKIEAGLDIDSTPHDSTYSLMMYLQER